MHGFQRSKYSKVISVDSFLVRKYTYSYNIPKTEGNHEEHSLSECSKIGL